MKQIEPIATAANFSAINIGKLNELNNYVLELGPDVKIPGKIFGGTALQATGGEFIPNVSTRHRNRFPPHPQNTRRIVFLLERYGRISGRRTGIPDTGGQRSTCGTGRKTLRTQQRNIAAHHALRTI